MEDYKNAIEIQNLSVRYDGFLLDDISFSVAKGSIMGFIGQNGAGKTTTIKAILNIIRRETGSIQLLGLDNIKKEREAKEQISAVFDEIPFQDHSILMSSHITSDLEKVADSVTFIHNGKLLLTGYKDDVLAEHGVIKCTKSDYREIAPEDIVSARVTDFGAEVMVKDRTACMKKYAGLAMDNASLEEIMLFYVNAKKGEWS
jgi:ABC-type multidrug transport system ATPase subunit